MLGEKHTKTYMDGLIFSLYPDVSDAVRGAWQIWRTTTMNIILFNSENDGVEQPNSCSTL